MKEKAWQVEVPVLQVCLVAADTLWLGTEKNTTYFRGGGISLSPV